MVKRIISKALLIAALLSAFVASGRALNTVTPDGSLCTWSFTQFECEDNGCLASPGGGIGYNCQGSSQGSCNCKAAVN